MGILTRAIKNLSRRKSRALIVIVALTLALTMLIILPPSINVRQELTQQAINGLIGSTEVLKTTVTLSATEIQCSYPIPFPDISSITGSNNSDLWLKQPLMNQSLYNNITAIPDVTTVISTLNILPTANRSYALYGVPLENASYQMDPTILPANITEGRNLQVGDTGVIVLDELTARNFSVSIGETFTIQGRNFIVVGIEGSELPKSMHGATMSLSDAWLITNTTGQAAAYRVFVDNVDNVNSVITRIRGLDLNLQVSAGLSQLNNAQPLQDQITELTKASQNNLNQIQSTGIIEIGIAVIADTAIILFIMLYSVRERTREIGTLKALGASDAKIIGQFMLEGVILSVVAAVFAIVISVTALPVLSSLLLPTPVQTGVSISYYPNGTMYLGATSFGTTPVMPGQESNVIAASISPEIVMMGLGAAILLGSIGSLYPALKAARTKPAEAMRYE